MQLAPNTLVDGKYLVLRQIGEGGMASVYEAENQRLGMRVALKLMHISVKSSESNVQRFLREASALASLNHPNIVRILDVVEHEGAPVLVMELLNGKSLGDLLEAGQRPNANDVFQIASQSLAALQHAHQLGIVHRDIKPDNIFRHVAPTGEATYKLVDFGIARGAEDHSLTSTGQFVGTRRYASPEQIRDPRAVDARTDLYSLGVTLWECVTGETPHAGAETEFSVMRAITETPYFAVSPGRVDERIGRLIARLTANGANDRFISASEALQFLNTHAAPASFAKVGAEAATVAASAPNAYIAPSYPASSSFPPPAVTSANFRDARDEARGTSGAAVHAAERKSMSYAVLLSLFLGPIGIMYTHFWLGVIVSAIVTVLVVPFSFDIADYPIYSFVLFVLFIYTLYESYRGVIRYNDKLATNASDGVYQAPKKGWVAILLGALLGSAGVVYTDFKRGVWLTVAQVVLYLPYEMLALNIDATGKLLSITMTSGVVTVLLAVIGVWRYNRKQGDLEPLQQRPTY